MTAKQKRMVLLKEYRGIDQESDFLSCPGEYMVITVHKFETMTRKMGNLVVPSSGSCIAGSIQNSLFSYISPYMFDRLKIVQNGVMPIPFFIMPEYLHTILMLIVKQSDAYYLFVYETTPYIDQNPDYIKGLQSLLGKFTKILENYFGIKKFYMHYSIPAHYPNIQDICSSLALIYGYHYSVYYSEQLKAGTTVQIEGSPDTLKSLNSVHHLYRQYRAIGKMVSGVRFYSCDDADKEQLAQLVKTLEQKITGKIDCSQNKIISIANDSCIPFTVVYGKSLGARYIYDLYTENCSGNSTDQRILNSASMYSIIQSKGKIRPEVIRKSDFNKVLIYILAGFIPIEGAIAGSIIFELNIGSNASTAGAMDKLRTITSFTEQEYSEISKYLELYDMF